MTDPVSIELSPGQKAMKTARWARTMTKWLITFTNKRGVKWQFVEFGGSTGSESYGIVDILAIRKDHRTTNGDIKRGDLFEIVLIQTKGGGARRPSKEDRQRLRVVAQYYSAKDVVLAEWKRKETLQLYRLSQDEWVEIDPQDVFG